MGGGTERQRKVVGTCRKNCETEEMGNHRVLYIKVQ
jgi:hypothetical protein